MNKHLMALLGIAAALLLVAGCGKKGPLEAPEGASGKAPEMETPDRTMAPIDNPSVTPQWPGSYSSTGRPRQGN